jgi:FKBP-type peptidyl-prolyl cis-trans isomerase FklB
LKRIRLLVLGILVLAGAGIAALRLTAQPAPTLDTQQKRVSYAIGLNLGRSLASQKVDTDFDSLARGVRDGIAGTALMDDKQIEETMSTFEQEMRSRRTASGAKNQSEGAAFLADNGKRPAVKTTASGLQYEILSAGDGPKPKATDRVRVHYKGSLINGTEFDSSYERGEPAVFPANRVIPGWTEALQLMTVGSKWKLFIPAALGYGEQGAGAAIPPHSTLIFEVELLGIEP